MIAQAIKHKGEIESGAPEEGLTVKYLPPSSGPTIAQSNVTGWRQTIQTIAPAGSLTTVFFAECS